jgi:hypothetical protein
LKLQTETYRAYRRFYSLGRIGLDLLSMAANVVLDALVWHLGRANLYKLDTVLIRAGGKMIVSRGSRVHDAYLAFLADTERRQVLRAVAPRTEIESSVPSGR